jgi:hypothetical protein
VAGETQPGWWVKLPTAEKARAWESQYPGAAQLMLNEALKNVRHERRLGWAQVFIQLLTVLFAGGSVVLFVWLAKYFVDHGAPTQGAAIVGTGLAALVGTFVGREAYAQKRGKSREQ